jgi:Spy/CpxP family protein refolding chaperone
MNNTMRGLVLCIAVAGLAGGAWAQAPTTDPSPPPDHPWQRNGGGDHERGHWHHHHHHWHHHRWGDEQWGHGEGGWGHGGPGLLGNLRELDLTPAQHEQIHRIMQGARDQWKMPEGAGPGKSPMAALENPGDPGYSAAVQAAKQRAGERIQAMSDRQTNVYNVLTAPQKSAYAQLLADKKARWEKWQQDGHDHGPGGDHGKPPPDGGATP